MLCKKNKFQIAIIQDNYNLTFIINAVYQLRLREMKIQKQTTHSNNDGITLPNYAVIQNLKADN